MKHTNSLLLIYALVLILLLTDTSCKSQKKTAIVTNEIKQETFINPPIIIYKTKKDYFNNVPVGLSEDKKSVVSYPDKVDIYHGGILATPTRLANGYLLDNRGIGKNSAFTNYSYEEYSKLTDTPTAEALFSQIIDLEPFLEMYSCKCQRDTVELNRMIRRGLEGECKKID
jgi:hypothetical protein